MSEKTTSDTSDSPLSLKRLTAAFAQMLGSPQAAAAPASDSPADSSAGLAAEPMADDLGPSAHDPCEISPQSIVEGVLFVGASKGESLRADQLAAAMRDVSPAEVAAAVEQLNAIYDRDAAPYYIASEGGGYRLTLREDMQRMGSKFQGRIKETKLSPAAMEVLSIIAYRQPVTIADVEHLRGARSGSLLSSLVRRGLVRLDRPTTPDAPTPPAMPAPQATKSTSQMVHYQTTDRFLRLFGLGHINQLPRAAEMDD